MKSHTKRQSKRETKRENTKSFSYNLIYWHISNESTKQTQQSIALEVVAVAVAIAVAEEYIVLAIVSMSLFTKKKTMETTSCLAVCSLRLRLW